MYSLIKTLAQPANERGTWLEVDISTIGTRKLIELYEEAYITVYNPFKKKNETTLLSKLTQDLAIANVTFEYYLQSLGSKALPVIDYEVVIKDRKVRYIDAFKAGYKLEAVPEIASPDANLARADRPYISLKKEGVDPKYFYEHTLVTVNGFLHRVDYSDSGIWVIDGMKTVDVSDDNCVGLISFEELGTLDIIPITEDMIYSHVADNPLYDQCYIDIKKDTSDKTIILSIGGYLHIYDWLTFRRIGDSNIRIDFKNIPLFERFHESKRFISFKDAPLEKGWDEGGVAIGHLTSNDFIKWYLQMPQSFVALLDNEDIYVSRTNVRATKLPKQYISHTEPTQPLINGIGKFGNYWSVYEKGQWALNLTENQYHNWGYDTSGNYKLFNAVTNSRVPAEQTEFSEAYLLNIGSMIDKSANNA